MKKLISIMAVTLFVLGMTGCCCKKASGCPEGCAKPCCEKPTAE